MSPSRRIVAPVLLFTVLAPLAAAAQPAPPPPPAPGAPIVLTIGEAVERATTTSHRLAEARAREAGARAAVDVQRTADRPSVAALAGYTRTNEVPEFSVRQPGEGIQVVYPNIPDNVRARLDLQWPIYTGGRANALERAAAAEADASAADLAVARLDLRLEVVRASWALVTATESVRVLEAALARAEAALADVRTRFETGFLPPNDVASSEAQRARQEVLLIEARNQRDATEVDLRRLTGIEGDTPIVIAEPLEPAPAPASAATAELVAEAFQRRPERQALTLRIGGAEQRVDAVAAARRPTIAVVGGLDYASPNPRFFPRSSAWQDSWDIGVNASWLLWDGGRNSAERAEATAAVTATRERLAELDTLIAADIRQRQLDLSSNRAAVVAASAGVRAAAEARRVVGDRFAAGVATTTDVLDAQQALLTAELDRTRALAGVRLAEARLERALGR